MRTRLFTTLSLIAMVALITSCATTSPNQALIIGKWKPVAVEKIMPEKATATDQQTAMTGATGSSTTPGGTKPTETKAGKGGSSGENAARAEEKFNRLYRAEQKATLEVFADKTAVKDYNGTYVKATWKMKPSGKKLVAKNIKTKEKFVLDILEINEKQAVIMENLPVGSLKITYVKE